jgi:hypothetical protein
MSGTRETGFDSPEEAALATFDPVARARVLDVSYPEPGRAEVLVDIEPSYPTLNRCIEVDRRWFWSGDSRR